MAEKRLHVHIQGRVQGVWFRDSTRAEAVPLGLTGWVRNLSDGRVEAVFEGEEEKLEEILSWCYQGSPNSRVDRVEQDWGAATGEFKDFQVTY